MKNLYKRFWFEFDIEKGYTFPAGIGLGIGITAIDSNDAIQMMKRKIFNNATMPFIKKITENVDIRTLDQGHLIPNMKPPHERGIWFPLGYD